MTLRLIEDHLLVGTEAVRYFRELGAPWDAADGGRGRQTLAMALFERVDVRKFRDVTLRLTDEAIPHGFAAVLPRAVRNIRKWSGREESHLHDRP